MASTIAKLYDVKTKLEIPASMRAWRVTQADVDAALAVMAREHAYLERVKTVQTGDTVHCQALDSGKYAGRTVLLYPGQNMRGARKAEQAVLSLKEGDRFGTELGGVHIDDPRKTQEENQAGFDACHGEPVQLEIREIWRLRDMEISDQLAKAKGFETLEQLKESYITEYQPQKLTQVKTELVRLVLKALLDHSEYDMDPEEAKAWTEAKGKQMYDMLIRNGADPHIPEEGFVFLTDEEALEKLTREQLPQYKEMVMLRYLAQQGGLQYSWEQFTREIDELWANYGQEAQAAGVKKEDYYRQDVYESYRERAYTNMAFGYLMSWVQDMLEP